MSDLRETDTSTVRHSWTVSQPSAIQAIAYILLLIVVAYSIVWLSSYRSTGQRYAVSEKTRDHPNECPFTIHQLNKTTWLIRENDRFGEYPHIYVKKYTETGPDGQEASVLIVNDTGCGTSTPNHKSNTQEWNIKTFIDHHLNPNGENMPYLIILSHCHYDHILGLEPIFRSTKDAQQPLYHQIMSSSWDRTFLEPRSHLIEHSLCKSMNLSCPLYEPTKWAVDNQTSVEFLHPKRPMRLPITMITLPGHTPDSLGWWDNHERVLYVGDMLYERESAATQTAPWGREKPAPILFPNEGDLAHWWWNLSRLLVFVESNNEQGLLRVRISAGHVTANADAMVTLLGVKEFMMKVLRDEVRFEEQPEKRGLRFGFWSEEAGKFSLGAPLKVVEEGRLRIPENEWR